MIRLAWHWLGQWHEPLSVGAAVALVGLIYLMPVSGGAALLPPHQSGSVAQQHAPADAQYYRDQWRRDTAAFYALHPPRHDERPGASVVTSAVTTAKASFVPSQSAANSVTQAAHIAAGTPLPATVAAQPLAPLPTATAAGRPPEWRKRWQIAASLAAGLLAGLVFASVWPASAIGVASGLSQPDDDASASGSRGAADAASPLAAETGGGELIAIRLPAAWVGVRPTTGESLRRAILAASYLIASLCGWSLLG